SQPTPLGVREPKPPGDERSQEMPSETTYFVRPPPSRNAAKTALALPEKKGGRASVRVSDTTARNLPDRGGHIVACASSSPVSWSPPLPTRSARPTSSRRPIWSGRAAASGR